MKLTSYCGLMAGLLCASPGWADFATVLNIPPQPNIGDFQSVGSDTQVNLGDSGSIGDFFNVGNGDGSSTNVELNVFGGEVGSFLDANRGSTVNIAGGEVGSFLNAHEGSTINVLGGLILGAMDVRTGASLNISGGTVVGFDGGIESAVAVSGGLVAGSSSTEGSLQITSGIFDSNLAAISGSDVGLFGSGFRINNLPIPGLVPGVPFVVGVRDLDGNGTVILDGKLADGSDFNFDLNAVENPNDPNSDIFDVNATLTVTLFDRVLGDYNDNGVVDAADYPVWLDSLGQSVAKGSGADGNFDGVINGLDNQVWETQFSHSLICNNTGRAIPEPATGWLIGLGVWFFGFFRVRY